METQKTKNKSIALISAGIAIGVAVSFVGYFVYVSVQPTIYDKLTETGITYFLSHWESDLLENRTYVHQFKEFDEMVQLAEMLKVIDQELVVSLDKTYNINLANRPNQRRLDIHLFLYRTRLAHYLLSGLSQNLSSIPISLSFFFSFTHIPIINVG